MPSFPQKSAAPSKRSPQVGQILPRFGADAIAAGAGNGAPPGARDAGMRLAPSVGQNVVGGSKSRPHFGHIIASGPAAGPAATTWTLGFARAAAAAATLSS